MEITFMHGVAAVIIIAAVDYAIKVAIIHWIDELLSDDEYR